MDIEKIFKPIEPKRIPIPATEASQCRSLNNLINNIDRKLSSYVKEEKRSMG
jgi:hypothetical protein